MFTKEHGVSVMTTGTAPKFITSPYFVPEAGNWHLKPGAPKEVVEEFESFMEAHKKWESQFECERKE